MGSREGVVKYSLDHKNESCLTPSMVASINGWRNILYRLQLIGQDAERYMGYGFGNISMRATLSSGIFIISGTQTGRLPFLNASEYSLVTAFDPGTNSISSSGEIKPSSEALTHGQLYRLDDHIGSVVHVHSPEIWRMAESLELPLTSGAVSYGTPEMALEVEALFSTTAVCEKKIFVMAGHEDGVVSFGHDVHEACIIMIETLARAIILARSEVTAAAD